ncbi:MAG: hypothetical protein R3265_04895, partial [Hyphomonas sp.]|nr:hypothetical protein [Hyphomonas sp.]
SLRVWFGWLAALATAVAAVFAFVHFIAKDRVERVIPNKAREVQDQRRQTLLDLPESSWPDWLLLENGWTQEDHGNDLKSFILVSTENNSGAHSTDIILKRGSQTLVWANAIALGDRYVWPYSGEGDELEDGENTITVHRAIAGIGLSDFVRKNIDARIDIVGVGLESSHGGDDTDVYRNLSVARGRKLISASEQSIEVPVLSTQLNYRVLGLGRALTAVEKGSDAERRQRSVLILALARKSHDEIMFSVEDAIDFLVTDFDFLSPELSDYEYACVIKERLSPVLKLVENSTEWTAPELSASEAVSRRPCAD